MFIEALKLIHYRNYQNECINFKKGINIILGENAQGKTNLIEAMFFLSRGYSHRASSVAELAQWDHDDFFISARVVSEDVKHTLSAKNHLGKRQFLLDEKVKKRDKINGIFNTILFEPDDLKIVKEGPDKRRRFLNQEISGFKPEYHYILRDYEKILNQRNSLLKNINYQPSLITTLDVWDEQIIEMGVRLMNHRIRYLHRLNREANNLHQLLSLGKETLSLFYLNNIIDSLEELSEIKNHYQKRLESSREEDIARGSTSYGPHVDDMIIQINGKDARRYGSQGQQRSAAISLKLSQIEIYYENTGEYPVVLLDDIFSELDEHRRKSILSLLNKTQAFITCTEDSLIDREEKNKNTIVIAQGKVQVSIKKP
ncbi:DNA replication/repair protein RecF [Acetobacterium woodii]|uniref:DNA replication and repair protein RecF n=1 Tax=Acetobacterium woodii (strain ATCC 29683 / DSM 1030 / JCM 2381 / KCTC 1655 / WB1) TaxID=931626 RepID=H6LEA4_ACEWD|nr:DNA replication/repair protein RecF [Acetobacterium woodii]AFA46818.1 DNA replication and repair protein RecF [Acetobacterium woodii DSM 1030]